MSIVPAQWSRTRPFSTEPHEPFVRMLQRAERLLDAGFLEFAVLQSHITLDFFINLVLEAQFLPRLGTLREAVPEIHRLFLKATWEEPSARRYISFLDKFGDYSRAIGVDFKGQDLFQRLRELNATRDGIVHNRHFSSSLSATKVTEFIDLSFAVIKYFLQHLNTLASLLSPAIASHYEFSDNDVRISVSDGDDKITDLRCEAAVRIHADDRSGVIVPEKRLSDDSCPFTVQVCGIDYVRCVSFHPEACLNYAEPWFLAG